MHKHSFDMLKVNKKLIFRLTAIVLPLIILVFVFVQPAMAKTTYIIDDGDRVSVHSGETLDPADVLDVAGYTLGDQDRYVTHDANGVSKITIYRTQNIDVFFCGQHIPVTSEGESVSELLSRMNIRITPDMTLSAGLEDSTFDGMEITINRDFSRIETYSQTIPFSVVYKDDAALAIDEERVIAEGVNGEETLTALVYYHNGQEVGREIQNRVVSLEPVDKVIAVGVESEIQVQAPVVDALGYSYGTIYLPTGEVLTYTDRIEVMGTAYTCEGWSSPGITASGTVARVGEIAVDPNLIPLGTRVFVRSMDGEYIYGIATAEDTGGLIIGHRIDLYMDKESECIEFGYRPCEVFILG